MRKRYFFAVLSILFATILLTGCGGKGSVKSLNAAFDSIVIDTMATTADGDVCKVHLKILVFKGKNSAQLNDSLMRMGILQPDYMAISYERLIPQTALSQYVSRLIAEQQEVFNGIRRQEPDTKPLLYELSCDTQVLTGANDGFIYIARMRTADSTGEPISWTVVRNIAPNGHWIKITDVYKDQELQQLPAQIINQLSEDLDLDDTLAVRKAGYFVGINAYPTTNFMLFTDSVRFVYVPGEVSLHAVNITLER